MAASESSAVGCAPQNTTLTIESVWRGWFGVSIASCADVSAARGGTNAQETAREFLGTATLVLFGCGSAVLAGPEVGQLGISFAFGLAIVAMAYGIGPVSGCHVNPAVSFGAYLAGRMSINEMVQYWVVSPRRRTDRRGHSLRPLRRARRATKSPSTASARMALATPISAGYPPRQRWRSRSLQPSSSSSTSVRRRPRRCP